MTRQTVPHQEHVGGSSCTCKDCGDKTMTALVDILKQMDPMHGLERCLRCGQIVDGDSKCPVCAVIAALSEAKTAAREGIQGLLANPSASHAGQTIMYLSSVTEGIDKLGEKEGS